MFARVPSSVLKRTRVCSSFRCFIVGRRYLPLDLAGRGFVRSTTLNPPSFPGAWILGFRGGIAKVFGHNNQLKGRSERRPDGIWALPGEIWQFSYVPCCISMVRILPIARVGLRPLGQTLTQFMMPRQRKTLNGSSKLASRSSVSVSRESAKKR